MTGTARVAGGTAGADGPGPPAGWEQGPAWQPAEFGALLVAAVAALFLRLHELTRAPVLDDNQDPLQFAWSGLTLITRHVPYAWEVFTRSYRYDYTLHLNGTQYHITHPWFSHPPLFSLLVGGWSYLMGARDLPDVTAQMIRPVAVALSIISLALGYVLARRILGIGPAMLGTAILALSPGAVLMGREVETEALLAPLLLAGLLVIHEVVTRRGGRLPVAGLLAICVAMPLVKVTGIVLAGGFALVLFSTGHWRLALGALAAGVSGLALFALYGAAYDWHLFLAVLAEWRDMHRHGVMAGLEFITDSAGIGGSFRDGWFHLGWLGIAYLAVRQRSGQAGVLLAWTCVAYAGGIALLGDAAVQGVFGWYRVVLYPLLYAAAGMLAWEAVTGPSLPALLLVIVVAGATATDEVLGSQWQPNPYLLAAVVSCILLPVAVSQWRATSAGWRLAAQSSAALALVAILGAGTVTSFILGDVYRQL
jgi:hypothetical protein